MNSKAAASASIWRTKLCESALTKRNLACVKHQKTGKQLNEKKIENPLRILIKEYE